MDDLFQNPQAGDMVKFSNVLFKRHSLDLHIKNLYLRFHRSDGGFGEFNVVDTSSHIEPSPNDSHFIAIHRNEFFVVTKTREEMSSFVFDGYIEIMQVSTLIPFVIPYHVIEVLEHGHKHD